MYTLPLTIRHKAQDIQEVLSREETISRIKHVLFWIVIADVLLLLVLFLKLLMIHQQPMPTITTSHYGSAPVVLQTGSETNSFVERLKNSNSNFSPVIVSNVSRKPLSVQGSTITLGGDSIQVFEYDTYADASKDAIVLAQKYISSSRSALWKSHIHIYVKDKLVIFYMGSDADIAKALDENAGISFMKPTSQKPIVLK